MPLVTKILWSIVGVFGALAYGLAIGGVIRKVMARIQGRIGPPVWQPYIDLGKNLSLRTATHHGVMSFIAPIFRAAGGIGVFLLVPVVIGVPALENFSFSGDLLMVMYFIFFGSLGMALGAAEAGHPHSPIGISRGLAQMSSYELPFALAVVALAAQAGSFSIREIILAQQGGWLHWNLFANPLAAAAAFLAFLGMNMYAPFNIVGAPQEIPVGPPTEFNSQFLSLLMVGRATFAVAKIVLYMDLFLGGARSLPEAFVKTFLIYFWSIFVGAVFPRFRTEQSIRFFLGWPTIAGIAGVLLVIFSH